MRNVVFVVMAAVAHAQPCQTLSAEKRWEIISYVAAIFRAPNAETLGMKEEEFKSTCWKKLTFENRPLVRPAIFFLSPDQRFLTPQILDTMENPTVVRQSAAAKVEPMLLEGAPLTRGDKDASLKLTIFSDLQCPACARLYGWIDALPKDLAGHVQIVYRHLPLPIHEWARSGALISYCVGVQSRDAFWGLLSFTFDHQNLLTRDNLQTQLLGFAEEVPGLDLAKIRICLNSREANEFIEQDIALAQKLDVKSTPAIFINGDRIPSPHSSLELLHRLNEAMEPGGTVRKSTKSESK